MKFWDRLRKFLLLLSPLAFYPVTIFIYYRLTGEYFGDLFGCGCYFEGKLPGFPFNANDVNGFFWQFYTVCISIVFILLSRKIPKNKIWLRIIYIISMIAISVFIGYKIWQRFLWN